MESRLSIPVTFLVFLLLASCEQPREHTAPAINERDSVSMMTTYGVNTLISDSGVIKYRIVTERWDVNTIKWELRGRVRIRNVNGLVFRSEELFWDGLKHEFYSYKYSKVITPERELEGTYFRSDEHMRHYEVTNSVGSFQSEDLEPEPEEPAKEPEKNTNAADTAKQEKPVRPAAVKHKATTKPVTRP